MNRVRVVIAEMEGSDEAVLAAIRTCVGSAPTFTTNLETPAALPAPKELQIDTGTQDDQLASGFVAEVRETLKRGVSNKKKGKQAKPPKSSGNGVARAAGHETDDEGPTPAQTPIYERLKKGPMTSGEVIKAFPALNAGNVYSILNGLRNNRFIETRVDEADGQNKNFVV